MEGKNMVKFGIVIATYQRKDGTTPFYLTRTLDSIFSQTYQNFKVYVMGDKYDDEEELFGMVNKYPKDKLYCENLP